MARKRFIVRHVMPSRDGFRDALDLEDQLNNFPDEYFLQQCQPLPQGGFVLIGELLQPLEPDDGEREFSLVG